MLEEINSPAGCIKDWYWRVPLPAFHVNDKLFYENKKRWLLIVKQSLLNIQLIRFSWYETNAYISDFRS